MDEELAWGCRVPRSGLRGSATRQRYAIWSIYAIRDRSEPTTPSAGSEEISHPRHQPVPLRSGWTSIPAATTRATVGDLVNRIENPRVSILTGGRDPHYAIGFLSGLLGMPLSIDFVGNDAMRGERQSAPAVVRYVDLYPSATVNGLWRIAGLVRTYVALVRYF